MKSVTGAGGDGAVLLHGASASARVVALPDQPTVAQLMLLDHRFVPTSSDLTRWLAALVDHGYERVRSGALDERCAELFSRHEFHVVQRLLVLERQFPRPWHRLRRATSSRTGTARPKLRAMGAEDRAAAAVVDRAAFAPSWNLDERGLIDTCQATRHHRAIVATIDSTIVAHAICGRDGELGFLQRLAVDPDHQRSGIGSVLVADALRWMGRHRVDRVLLNTHTENSAAIALYLDHGFEVRPDQLVVAEAALR